MTTKTAWVITGTSGSCIDGDRQNWAACVCLSEEEANSRLAKLEEWQKENQYKPVKDRDRSSISDAFAVDCSLWDTCYNVEAVPIV